MLPECAQEQISLGVSCHVQTFEFLHGSSLTRLSAQADNLVNLFAVAEYFLHDLNLSTWNVTDECLTILQSEQPKFCGILAVLSTIA